MLYLSRVMKYGSEFDKSEVAVDTKFSILQQNPVRSLADQLSMSNEAVCGSEIPE
jgi:hypothetical protein